MNTKMTFENNPSKLKKMSKRHPSEINLYLLLTVFLLLISPVESATVPANQEDYFLSIDPFASDSINKHQAFERFFNIPDDQTGASKVANQGVVHLRNGNRAQGIKDLERAWGMAPSLVKIGLLLSTLHLIEEDYEKALIAALKLQDIQAENAQNYTLAGIAYSGLNDSENAKKSFSKALQLAPNSFSANKNLVNYITSEGNADQARILYNNMLSLKPDDLSTLLSLAELEFKSGNSKQAILTLEKAIQSHPESIEPHVTLARGYLLTGNPQKALSTANSATKKYPENPKLLEIIAVSKLQTKSPNEAVIALKAAIIMKPDSLTLHYNLARAYEKLNQTDLAMQEIEKALALDPEHAGSLFLKANRLAQKGEIDAAWMILKNLMDTYPGSPSIKELSGRVAMIRNDNLTAITLFKEALAIRESTLGTIDLASAQLRSGKIEDSITTLRNWLTKYPDDLLVRSTLADLLLGTKKFDEALQQYSEIIRLQPNLTRAWNNTSWIYKQKGDLNKALKYAEQAYSLEPKNPDVIDTYAGILLLKGQGKKATKLLREAVKKSPNQLNIHFHLAQALADTQNTDEAKKILKSLLAKNQKFNERQQAKDLLQKLGG